MGVPLLSCPSVLSTNETIFLLSSSVSFLWFIFISFSLCLTCLILFNTKRCATSFYSNLFFSFFCSPYRLLSSLLEPSAVGTTHVLASVQHSRTWIIISTSIVIFFLLSDFNYFFSSTDNWLRLSTPNLFLLKLFFCFSKSMNV